VGNLTGKLKGLMDSRDDILPHYLEKLDTLAAALVEQVNTLHRTGYGADGATDLDFFAPHNNKATNISVNTEIVGSPSKIAFSQSGEEGDTRTAKAIADLRTAEVLNNDTTSLHGYYNELVGSLGVDVQQARSFSENYSVLVNQIENEKLAVQGVNLDEEMASMVKYQHAYDAAARVVTFMDQALDTVINRLGVAGR
ncbi:hypothetical protein GF377_10500, partial [candidate division GN15 bacterium]|nr:hypothetical protein [candidate division GN15 bacterium]